MVRRLENSLQQDPSDANSFQPMHGLKLVVKEDVVPQEQMPHFPAVEKLAAKGLLAVETWTISVQ